MKSTGSFFSGLLIGAAAGAVIALLYAPEKGEVVRGEIKKKVKELEEELDTLRERLKEKGGEVKDDVKKRIKEIEDKLSELIQQYKKATSKTAEEAQGKAKSTAKA